MRLSRKKGVKKNKTAKKKYVMKGGIKTNLMKLIAAETPETQEIIKLIQQNPNDVGFVNDDTDDTALIIACENKMSDVALALIATGHSNPGNPDMNGNTALILACENKMSDVALALIATEHSNPGNPDMNGDTALMFACRHKMTNVALELIATEHSNPEQAANTTGNTALIIACENKMSDVALALIATKQSNPGNPDMNGDTALIIACQYEMSDVALSLIATGQSKPELVNIYNATALTFACENDMLNVAFAIIATQPITLPNISININSLKTFDVMDGKDKPIQDFISENTDNIVFIIDKKHCFNASKTNILKELDGSIKFECLVGDGRRGPDNINKLIKYCHIKQIANYLPIDFITYDNALQICNPLSGNIFQLTRSNKQLASSISQNILNGANFRGASHCQEGQGGAVYSVEKVIPDTSVAPAIMEESVEPSVVEKPNTSIRVEITNKTINTVEYSPTTTIQEVKENLFRQLELTGSIDRIRLIYRGKILSNDQLISQIVGYNAPTDTLVGTIKPLSGGKQSGGKQRRTKKRRTRTRTRKHKTKY
jgi:ankyrin repeat protein